MYRYINLFLTFLISLFNFSSISQARYSGGSGTQEAPYQISTSTDWLTLTNARDDWGKNFVLTDDLNLEGVTLSRIGLPFVTPFIGDFDGNGHIIRNADVNMPDSDYVGLFGYVAKNARIQNMCVEFEHF